MSDAQAMARPECDHAYSSIHQPDLPLYWVRQCVSCGDFDPVDMRREIRRIPLHWFRVHVLWPISARLRG